MKALEAVIRCRHVARHRTTVEAQSIESIGEHPSLTCLLTQSISNLKFAVAARRGVLKDAEDIRRQDIATDDRQIARRFLGPRLFHHVRDTVEPIA
jgi:hypothetical protein